MIDAIDLLTAIFRGMPDDERAILCGFTGDPGNKVNANWSPRGWRPGDVLPVRVRNPMANRYSTVASFETDTNGRWRRESGLFRRGFALMCDDVGTGAGSKVAPAVMQGMPPSVRVESSPHNFQYLYLLDAPCDEAWRFAALIEKFIARRLAGNDPGQAGTNRVVRLPGGINGKPKYADPLTGEPWRVRVADEDWHPERRYSIEDLVDGFDLGALLKPESRCDVPVRHQQAYEREFQALVNWMDANEVFQPHSRWRQKATGLWRDIHCPWVEEHTGRADNGAAVGWPSEANAYRGAFKCSHGHCADRGIRDFYDWFVERAEEAFEEAAARAGAR